MAYLFRIPSSGLPFFHEIEWYGELYVYGYGLSFWNYLFNCILAFYLKMKHEVKRTEKHLDRIHSLRKCQIVYATKWGFERTCFGCHWKRKSRVIGMIPYLYDLSYSFYLYLSESLAHEWYKALAFSLTMYSLNSKIVIRKVNHMWEFLWTSERRFTRKDACRFRLQPLMLSSNEK